MRRFARPAERWVDEVSYGRLDLTIDTQRQWFRMPSPAKSYGTAGGFSAEEHDRFLREAVRASDAAVDFSKYAAVYVLPARGSGLRRSSAYHVLPGTGIRADGNEIRHAVTFGDDVRAAPGTDLEGRVLIHETGHLLGLPDLYDTQSRDHLKLARFAGAWDVMSVHSGVHFIAWHKWKLGWLMPDQLRCVYQPARVVTTLSPLARPGGVKAVVVPTGPATALVVEARRRLGRDASLCEEGVLLYSVDTRISTGDGPIRVRRAQPDRNADRLHACGPLYNAPFDRARGEVSRFSDDATGVSVEVLASRRAGYVIRVVKR